MEPVEAFSMGLVAGFTPSPHSLFVAFASSQGRSRALAALAGGVMGDLVIIALTGTLLAHMPARAHGLFSLAGQALVFFMGYKIFSTPPPAKKISVSPPRGPALWAGLLVQLLNPYPYIFWAGVYFPRARQMPLAKAFTAALLFLTVVHFMKWLLYVRLVGAVSPRQRRFVTRSAFAVFASLYLYREWSHYFA